MAAGTQNIVNVFPILHLLTCCDSTISNQASPHLLRSLEPFPELWKRARSSLGASMAPPAEKVAGSLQETRSPNAAWKGRGSCPTRPGDHSAGSLGPPQAGPSKPRAPATQKTGRVHKLRAGRTLNLTSDTAPRSPQWWSWSLSLTAWPELWPHSPTGALEARPPLLGGAHPKPPLQRPIAL